MGLRTPSRLLTSKGWDACIQATVIRSTDPWEMAPTARNHSHILRRLFEDFGVDAVLCTEGRPTVCIKDAQSANDDDLRAVRNELWNFGATTLFVVGRQTQVQVFSTVTRPEQDQTVFNAQLSEETIGDLESLALALRIRQLVRRIETGAIYRDYPLLFDPKAAVDQQLLMNLRQVRDRICPTRTKEGYVRAHAMIGRFLFSCYLLDRGIIRDGYLERNGLPAVSDMLELLKVDGDGSYLNQLFGSLQRDFNGSLFGDTVSTVAAEEVRLFSRLLAGDDLRTGQRSLFKLYNFSYIPVEFISCIYQEFLAAESEVESPTPNKDKDRQRQQGAYYTPPRLAEMTIDIATSEWETLLDKRCMDAACGSGIFLVILFVRMAEEWRLRNPKAGTRERYDQFLTLLANNIFGVDVSPTACLVACFSLYLAFLDQMDPKEITELREVLERDYRKKLLPRLFWSLNDGVPKAPRLQTICECDFFELPPERKFDLVVGNPPWVSRRNSPSAERWLFSSDNPAAKGLLGKSGLVSKARHKILFPAKELACGFMWKSSLHTVANGHVCQVLPTRVFLSNNTDAFQTRWLGFHRLNAIWLLADYRFILFPGADCPCFVSKYRSRQDDEPLGDFEFISPKVSLTDPRSAVIPVGPEDQKKLSESEIANAATLNCAAIAWKKHHWGTPRDVRLIDRLMRLPKVERLTYSPGRKQKSGGNRQWARGQGFQPATESTLTKREAPAPIFWKTTDLFLDATKSVGNLVLTRAETVKIGDRYMDTGLLFPRSPLIYKAPLVLINKGCTKFLFSSFDVLFQDDFQSICAPKLQTKELLFLTAVLASPLAKYLLFHTTANIGIERDIARFEELLGLPFPLPSEMPNPQRAQEIVDECAATLETLSAELDREPENPLEARPSIKKVQKTLNSLVYDYFDLCRWERHLIDDTDRIFRRSSTPATVASKSLLTARDSTTIDRQKYAAELVATFRGWSRTKSRLWATTKLAPKAGLALVTFGVGGRARDYSEAIAEARVEALLASIQKSISSPEGKSIVCLRGFMFFQGAQVHLIKPLARRHWTRTAALNDADAISAQMMEDDGWGA